MERNLTNEEIIKKVEDYVNNTYIPDLIQKSYEEFSRIGFHRLHFTKLYKSIIALYYEDTYYVNCRLRGNDNRIYWETFAFDENDGEVYGCDLKPFVIYEYLWSDEVNKIREETLSIEDEDKKLKAKIEFTKRYNRLNKIYEVSKYSTMSPGFESFHFNLNEYMTSDFRNYMNSL